MAWSTPMTAVANTVFTAAQFNQFVRDNLNATSPALATAAGRMYISDGMNSIVERVPTTATIGTTETTTSTSYTDLATPGPSVTVTSGTRAIVFLRSGMENSTANAGSFVGFEVSGASALAAADSSAINIAGVAAASRLRIGAAYLIQTLTAGSNTFTAKYKVSAGTGTFNQRDIAVLPL